MNTSDLKQLLELGWPGIVTLAFCYLAIQYIRDQRAQIDWLRARVDDLEKQVIQIKADIRK